MVRGAGACCPFRLGVGPFIVVLAIGVLPGDALTIYASAAGYQGVKRSALSRTVATPRWYADSSPWNTPIPSGPAIVPQSAGWINALYNAIGQINVNQGAWTPAVVIARTSAPRGRVRLSNGWILDDVPLPRTLTPSADSDAHAVIVDAARGREYDFFRLSRSSTGKWRASGGVVLRLSGSGWYNGRYCARGVCGPWGTRASSAALGGGLIRLKDVRAGVIPHALACTAPRELIGPPTSPATTGDGGGGPGAMPMGSRLQLDPALDVSTLNLEPGEEMIARALQTYGAYIVDSSSAFACYAQNSSTLSANPYPSSWSSGISRDFILGMRVVAPPSVPIYDTHAVFGQPRR